MSLTITEHYAASAAHFMGGVLGVVTQLWLLFDFFPKIKMRDNLRRCHVMLSLGNICVSLFFFLSAVSHFEQAWIWGSKMCAFYAFWCKATPVGTAGFLAICLYAEYENAAKSSAAKNKSYSPYMFLAFANGIFWGVGAVTWADYGQEPAGFACTVIWYKVQLYVTLMASVGFGVPILIAVYYAYLLWSQGYLKDNLMAKAVCIIVITFNIQLGAYVLGYMAVLLGVELSVRAIGWASLWTKSLGCIHAFVYSYTLASDETEDDSSTKKKE